mgnify:CR=1 FL=1
MGTAPVRSAPAIDAAAIAERAARYRAAREQPLVQELIQRFAAEPLAQELIARDDWLARLAADAGPAAPGAERDDVRN